MPKQAHIHVSEAMCVLNIHRITHNLGRMQVFHAVTGATLPGCNCFLGYNALGRGVMKFDKESPYL